MKCENKNCSNEHNGSFGSGRFCSRKCANSRKFSLQSRIKKSLANGGDGIIDITDRFCGNCQKLLVNRHQKKYCSLKCQQEFQYKDYIRKWQNGEIDGLSGYQTAKPIKRFILEKYDNKCCKCGWNEKNPFTGKIPLELEHKDGNYKNNKEENLEILCPNCHSLTKTYKGANKGNGRKARIKYSLYAGVA